MRVLQILILLFLVNIFANAQVEKFGTLTGIVTDHVGAIIPKVRIKISNNKKQEFKIETNENGIYKINLPMGIYKIEAKMAGHKSVKVKNYQIKQNGEIKLDIVLDSYPTPIY